MKTSQRGKFIELGPMFKKKKNWSDLILLTQEIIKRRAEINVIETNK